MIVGKKTEGFYDVILRKDIVDKMSADEMSVDKMTRCSCDWLTNMSWPILHSTFNQMLSVK
jgi:hypothetical protein